MTPEEARTKLIGDVTKDMILAEDAVEEFIKAPGLPPLEGLVIMEAAIAHMRAIMYRMREHK